MATADQLLELIFCWINERERFADNLKKLAEELESLRKKCNVGECVGSSLKVIGAASMIGAGLATVLTGGAATPLMVLASTYSGIGSIICQTTKLIEHLCSSTTTKKLQNIEKKSNEIAKEIQQLFQKLKSEKEVNPLAEPDELEHHIMAEFLRAIARQSGLNVQIINDSVLNDMLIHMLQEFPLKMISDIDSHGAGGGPSSAGAGRRSEGQFGDWTGNYWPGGGSSSAGAGRRSERHFEDWMDISDKKSTPQRKLLTIISCVGVLSLVWIGIQHKGMHKGKVKLSNSVLHLLRSTRFQTSMMVVGGLDVVTLGVYMMSYALPEMMENWREMIEGNHVTEASQSMRDTASGIQETTRTLKEQIKKIKKLLQEIEQEQQKLKEIEKEKQKLQETENEKQKLQETEKEKQKLQETVKEESESESESEDPPAVNVGLLNVRSIKNKKEKRLKIKNLITENNLDVFLMTETWLEDNLDVFMTETWLENYTLSEVLHETCPPNFKFNQQSRDSRGGGVAILFLEELESMLTNKFLINSILVRCHQTPSFESITSFEYVLTALRHKEWDKDVLFINVYRPPIKITNAELTHFIHEFTDLLNKASTDYNSIIVAGDFNLKDKDRFKLVSILCDFDQHVNEPTHKKGGILDLVFSRNVEVFSVHIRDDKISDHSTVYFSIRPT